MSKALLVINFQNDFFKGGNMPLKGTRKVLKRGKELLSFFRENQWPVIHVNTENQFPDSTYLVPQTDGASTHPEMLPLESEKIIVKNHPNSFRQTDLKTFLKKKKINELVVIGFMTNVSVEATVQAGKELGFECVVISDACGTKSARFNDEKAKAELVQASYLATISQFYGQVLSGKEYIKKEKKALKKDSKAKKQEAAAERELETEESFSS